MKRNLCFLLSSVLICSALFSACTPTTGDAQPSPAVTESAAADPAVSEDPAASPAPTEVLDQAALDEAAEQFMSLLLDKQYDDCFAQFDETFATQVTATMLKNEWESVIAETGAFQNAGNTITTDSGDGYMVYDITNDFEHEGIITRIILSQATGKVATIYFNFTAKTVMTDASDLPEGVSEKNVSIGTNTDLKLNAKLTYPTTTEGAIPAVVLVHESGRNGMDEPIGANKFFKQLAYGLAQRGVAVLRYDKRTYADVSVVVATINEEVIDDAVAAKTVITEQTDVQISDVFVIGHNFGAMMAPRIMDEGDYKGMVLLGGSPRTFADILYAQYMGYIEQAGMTEGETETNLQFLEDEYAKAQAVLTMSEEELLTLTIFDMPAEYVKSIEEHPVAEYMTVLTKPALIIQGSNDIQVSAETDYQAFEPYAAANTNIEMKLYEGLNNLLMPSTSETPTGEEYTTPAAIDTVVLDDIATWIKAH